ncbi:hypothetical protein B0A55_00502 [Friedmanniomyces simplex]|uniref:Phospholipid/glycerol acyltransferase domain-containing protein n=1 Tax=Friedmanniomyces simplex TaxID=329884 RepID=A0A4U0XZU6_9PEZI|nr:hypothetical protein B0A55_00502 [Friedmanniomyces simplex]
MCESFGKMPKASGTSCTAKTSNGLPSGPWPWPLLVANLVLSLLLPLSVLLPNTCYDASSRIAESIWLGIQHIFTRANHAQILVSGAEHLRQGESAIVISNHVGWTDFYMIQELAVAARMLPRCRWFAKRELRWVPFLGWGLWAMGMCLVSREWTRDRREMERVFRGVVRRRWPVWLIAYSEATRYTASKRLEAEAWCRAHNKRLGHHVLYPRTRGFIACVQNLRKTQHVNSVYDVTIAYAKNGKEFQVPPRFTESLMLANLDERWRFFVHVDRYTIDTLPQSDDELAQWLEDRFVEKGMRLAHLQKLLAEGQPWDDSSLSRLRLN